MSICVNIHVLSFWMRHLAALPCRDHGGGLKAFARGGRGEISLNDSSIRDLTCALIISWAPLQISVSNRRQIWQAPALLLTIPTPLTLPPLHHHCRHYTYPSWCTQASLWSKTPLLVTEAPICLPTIEKTGRERLTVRVNERHAHEYSILESTDKKHMRCLFLLWHIFPCFFTE